MCISPVQRWKKEWGKLKRVKTTHCLRVMSVAQQVIVQCWCSEACEFKSPDFSKKCTMLEIVYWKNSMPFCKGNTWKYSRTDNQQRLFHQEVCQSSRLPATQICMWEVTYRHLPYCTLVLCCEGFPLRRTVFVSANQNRLPCTQKVFCEFFHKYIRQRRAVEFIKDYERLK